MSKKNFIVVKYYEPDNKNKYHDLKFDSEYETIGTVDGVGVPMGSVPLEEDEVDIVENLPHVEGVYEDRDVTIPEPPMISDDVSVNYMPDVHNASEVYKKGFRGKGVKVGIIDTGIDEVHARNTLKDRLKAARSFVGSSSVWDYQSHGTHVAGIIFSVAPEADFYVAKGLGDDGSGTFSGIISALEWLVGQGCKIINMSLGGTGSKISPVSRAVDSASARGVMVVVAAGNSGCSGYTADSQAPANADSAITIAATDRNKKVASFSSCGNCVELSAFGYAVPSWGLKGTTGKVMSGTSMAAPHVSGIAALLLSTGKILEARKALLSGTVDTLEPVVKEGMGFSDALLAYNKLFPKEQSAPPLEEKEEGRGYYPDLPRVFVSRFSKNISREHVVVTGRHKVKEIGHYEPKEGLL